MKAHRGSLAQACRPARPRAVSRVNLRWHGARRLTVTQIGAEPSRSTGISPVSALRHDDSSGPPAAAMRTPEMQLADGLIAMSTLHERLEVCFALMVA